MRGNSVFFAYSFEVSYSSFTCGTKFSNYIKTGFQDMLDNNLDMTPWAFTFLLECSFVVFSTNKLWVIMLCCKYKKKTPNKQTNKQTSLNFDPYPLFNGKCIFTQF